MISAKLDFGKVDLSADEPGPVEATLPQERMAATRIHGADEAMNWLSLFLAGLLACSWSGRAIAVMPNPCYEMGPSSLWQHVH